MCHWYVQLPPFFWRHLSYASDPSYFLSFRALSGSCKSLGLSTAGASITLLFFPSIYGVGTSTSGLDPSLNIPASLLSLAVRSDIGHRLTTPGQHLGILDVHSSFTTNLKDLSLNFPCANHILYTSNPGELSRWPPTQVRRCPPFIGPSTHAGPRGTA